MIDKFAKLKKKIKLYAHINHNQILINGCKRVSNCDSVLEANLQDQVLVWFPDRLSNENGSGFAAEIPLYSQRQTLPGHVYPLRYNFLCEEATSAPVSCVRLLRKSLFALICACDLSLGYCILAHRYWFR